MTIHRICRCNDFSIGFEGKGKSARPSTLDAYVDAEIHDAAMHHLALGQAEVSYLVESVLQENVGRLEIPMDDIKSPQIPKSLADLPKHIQYLLLLIRVIFLVAVIEK